ncbi:anti-sigma factor family protein [Bacillus sp. N9]
MKHKTFEKWLQYVQDDLDEQTRVEYENHLYSCDDCLELYLQAVEANEAQMPSLPAAMDFTDTIMKEIEFSNKRKNPEIRRKQTFIHYALAAAMTLLLMSTGVFSHLMNVASEFENKGMNTKNRSSMHF